MKTSKKHLEPVTLKKRKLIEELYQLIQSEADKPNAFFDVQIDKESPKNSRIVANRPGVELFATELMMETEIMFDESYAPGHGNYSEPISVGKWCKRKANVHFTDLELTDITKYQNSFDHNEVSSFNRGFFSSFSIYFKLIIYVLALFGAVAVFKFFTR